jgi:putative ABC transport system permease protein
VAGVAFAVTMVLLQLGFYGAVEITATNNYEQLDFDVVLLAATYDQFFNPGEFPRERLRQARSLDSVEGAAPLYATFNLWRCPPYPPDDPAIARDDERPEPGPLRRWLLGDRLPRPLRRRELLVIGVSLEQDPFLGPVRRSIDEAAPRLEQPRCVLLDELSNLDFGWPMVGRFDGWEMGRTAVRIVGGFPMLRGFAADGVAICSDVNFARLCERPRRPAAPCGESCRRTSFPTRGPRSSARRRTTGSARRRPASYLPSACWSRRSWPRR